MSSTGTGRCENMKRTDIIAALCICVMLVGPGMAMSTSGIGFDSTNSGSYASVGAGSSTTNSWWDSFMAWWAGAWNNVLSMGSEGGWNNGGSASIAPNLDSMIANGGR